MSMKYVTTLPIVDYNTIINKNSSLSASRYQGFYIKNKNRRKVKDFLVRPLSSNDLGEEVGSINYISQSPKCFLKAKALQSHSYIPHITSESVEYIRPCCYVNQMLSKGDFIISKDSNIGEAVMLDKDYPNTMLSGALYRLPVAKYKHYLLAFLKHPLFKEQLDYLTPKGSTIRHCKTLFLDCEIPMPNSDCEKTVSYIEQLVQAIIVKESLIVTRFDQIQNLINSELNTNQKCGGTFSYSLPTYNDIKEMSRLDAKPYSEECKKALFTIKNYKGGFKTISDMGFSLSRGQNLQVSCIGKSVYSEKQHPGYYTLMLPKFLSKYGTCEKVEYFGNSHSLKTLQTGDIVFGAEGFEKGRSIVIVESTSKTITNIHGITIKNLSGGTLIDAVFVKCFLDYLRSIGLIDLLAVGGNGGSLAQKYWSMIPFPVFPKKKRTMISKLYHNPKAIFDATSMSDDNFIDQNAKFNESAGIYELDKAVKHLKDRLNVAIELIADDKPVCREY